MHTRLFVLLAALVAAPGATAVPAFTADSGTVTLSVTAQAPAAPCLALDSTTLNFGSQAFSTPTHVVSPLQQTGARNCGTVDEQILGSGSDATGPSGAWALTTNVGGPQGVCADGINRYALQAGENLLTSAPQLLTTNGTAHVFAPSQSSQLLQFFLMMPCQGSNGAGETKTFSANFTAVVS